MKNHDLHTHTNYSDGIHSPEKLITIAKDRDVEILGFSDHLFNRFISPEQTDFYLKKISEYISTLQILKNQNNDCIDIKIGAEVDFSERHGVSTEKLPFDLFNKLDYILFENMDFAPKLGKSLYELIKIRDKLEIPVGLAHYDMQNVWQGKENEIAKRLSENDFFVELNVAESGSKMRNGKYFFEHFSKKMIEELVEKSVKFTMGSDSHYGWKLGHVKEAYDFILKHNLEVLDIVK